MSELQVFALLGVAVAVYALTAGADFGGGVWDLLASGPRRADQAGREDDVRCELDHARGMDHADRDLGLVRPLVDRGGEFLLRPGIIGFLNGFAAGGHQSVVAAIIHGPFEDIVTGSH